MRTSTPVAALFAMALLAPALAACAGAAAPGPTSSGVGTAAFASDGRVVLYSGRDEALIQPLIDEFEAASGIDVDVRYDGTTALAALLSEEGERTPADVFLSQDAGALGALSRAGLFTTLPDAVADAVPDGFTSTDGSWVGLTGRARVIVYDGQEIADDAVPTSVAELTAPEWSGRVGVPPTNASFQAFVTAFRVLEGEDAARAWLEAMVSNGVQRFESNGAILEAVNSGRLDAGLINHYYWYRTAAEAGQDNMRARLAFLPPGDPGALVNVTGAGILAGAAADADALDLVRFLLSEEGQSYFVANTYEYPLVPGIAAPEGLPPLEDLRTPDLDLSDLDSLEQTVDLIAAVGLT